MTKKKAEMINIKILKQNKEMLLKKKKVFSV